MSQQDEYEVGLEILREHAEEICFRVMKGRSEGKGNFGYLEDDNIKHQMRVARYLTHMLSKMDLELTGRVDKEGYCDKMCYDCTYRRYNFHPQKSPEHWSHESPEGWYCQAECECK